MTERGSTSQGLPPRKFISPPFQESPAKCPISADPPISLYLVDIACRPQICHFAGDSSFRGETKRGVGAASVRWRLSGRSGRTRSPQTLVGSHPPPNLPPKRSLLQNAQFLRIR